MKRFNSPPSRYPAVLMSANDAIINNLFYHSSVDTKLTPNKELPSVTVVNNQNLSGERLVERVQSELNHYCGITSSTFI